MSVARDPSKVPFGFIANLKKEKAGLIQLGAMTAVLYLSIKSVAMKYHVKELQEEMVDLKEEQKNLTDRLTNIKNGLLHEAFLDSTGLFASRLRHLFAEGKSKEISSRLGL